MRRGSIPGAMVRSTASKSNGSLIIRQHGTSSKEVELLSFLQLSLSPPFVLPFVLVLLFFAFVFFAQWRNDTVDEDAAPAVVVVVLDTTVWVCRPRSSNPCLPQIGRAHV